MWLIVPFPESSEGCCSFRQWKSPKFNPERYMKVLFGLCEITKKKSFQVLALKGNRLETSLYKKSDDFISVGFEPSNTVPPSRIRAVTMYSTVSAATQ